MSEDPPTELPRGARGPHRKEAGDVLPGLGVAGKRRPSGNHRRAHENITLISQREIPPRPRGQETDVWASSPLSAPSPQLRSLPGVKEQLKVEEDEQNRGEKRPLSLNGPRPGEGDLRFNRQISASGVWLRV